MWPELDRRALHGPVGAFTEDAAPHTEADPAAILVSSLVLLGAEVGRGPHLLAGNERHGTSLFAVMVGATAKGAKGTSFAVGRGLAEIVDPKFTARRILGGFGSGEAVVDEVRDPDPDNLDDRGAPDKRLLVFEGEYARMLKVAGRDGSILSMIIRDAWDGRRLEARSRGRTSVASDAFVAVLGHVTVEELRARMTSIEIYGGLAGRYLYVATRRSRLLPSGGNVPEEVFTKHGAQIRPVVEQAKHFGRFRRTDAAEKVWADVYEELAEDEPGGLLGAAIARDAPQCLRLALLYAVLDGAAVIDTEHVEAAYALWRYCRASAAYVFGDQLGDEVADRLLQAIRSAGETGLSGTAQRDVFGRHQTGERLAQARRYLEERGLIVTTSITTGGRSGVTSVATKATKATEGTHSSPRSLTSHCTDGESHHGASLDHRKRSIMSDDALS